MKPSKHLSCSPPGLIAGLCAGLLACGGTASPPQASPDMTSPPAPPPLGTPISVPANAWTWVDFPDSKCDDGSATGIAVNPSSTSSVNSNNLLIFLEGGGACWDRTTCLVLNTATHGPFAKTQFDAMVPQLANTILDRQLASPFQDYSLVFVPYCTGDVHAGNNTPDFGTTGAPHPYYFHGYPNITAFLKRIAATFPSPQHLVFTGSSAGGFGAAFNYDQARSYFPGVARAYLIDDAGPPLMGDAIQPFLRMDWYSAWQLSQTIGPLCPNCQNDFSSAVPLLHSRYPNDRFALLSYTQDAVISGYFLLSASAFQTDLLALATQVLDPTPNFKYYFPTGTRHTLLEDPKTVTPPGSAPAVLDWLTQMVSDDASWQSYKP